jgi:hypothetical protein
VRPPRCPSLELSTIGTPLSFLFRPELSSMAGTPRERRSVSASKVSNIEKYNNERGSGRRRPAKSSDDDPEKTRIKITLQKYLAEMKKDHVYVAKNVLAAARMDLNRQFIFRGNEQGDRPGVIYDEESPFKNMKGIETTATDGAQRANVFKFKVTRYTKPNTSAPPIHIEVPTVLATVAEGTPLPKKCRSYTTLRNNIVADNEEEMRYLPYFGEAADDDVLHELNLDELYIDKTKESADEGRIMECEPRIFRSLLSLDLTGDRCYHVWYFHK